MKIDKYKKPETLDEAIDILKDFYKENLDEIKEMDEGSFGASVHMSNGMQIRNAWHLWWYDGHDYPDAWPAEKPKIVEYFNSIDIVHADDMSGIIMDSFHRSLRGEDLDIEGQVKKYHAHWKKQGYTDGIPTR